MPNRTPKPITTEDQLYRTLVSYMRRHGPVHSYPVALVELVEFIVREIPGALSEDAVLLEFYNDHRAASTVLWRLFEAMADTTDQRPCSSMLIAFAAKVITMPPGCICLDMANREAIHLLGLGARGLLFEETRGGTSWLVIGSGAERASGCIELEQHEAISGHVGPPCPTCARTSLLALPR